MIRCLYTLLFYISVPLILLRLLWRSIRAPQYRHRWSERFGFFPVQNNVVPCVWLHTVSVGETIAAKPLIVSLLAAYPQHCLLITTMTPTGSAQVRRLFAQEIVQGRVLHSYIPYDLPDCLQRFLSRVRPQLAIFMETEVWPNTLFTCDKNNIPTVLINARLSEKSLAGYQKVSSLSRMAFSSISHVIAQTQADADRIIQLGVTSISVSGNLKSDISLDGELRRQAESLKSTWSLNGRKKIIIAASTHNGEDEIILSAFQTQIIKNPELLLLIVPRHPERFTTVKQLCVAQGFHTITRSENMCVNDQTQVIVGDTMGEMMLFYGVSDIAVVCGSFIEHGGHNMLEPAVWGLPIISGNSVYNFAKIADDMQLQGGLLLVNGERELCEQLDTLLNDIVLAAALGDQAKKYLNNSAGALNTTLQTIDRFIKK